MNIIKITDLNKLVIANIFSFTKMYYESKNKQETLKLLFPFVDVSNKILVSAFFEPSTRTQLSFESAMVRLGGNVIRFNKDTSSVKKGETFYDTIKTISNYGDIMTIRHPEKGILDNISTITDIPVISGGDGSGEHPTQALLDLFCIWLKYDNYISNKKIILYGDCLKSRTISSLSTLLDIFEIEYYYLPYPGRELETEEFKNKCITLEQLSEINPDVIYCTRMQNERGDGGDIPENMIINDNFISRYISEEKIINDTFLLLHPLPRNKEINIECDNQKYAGYFNAIEYGVYLRGILICMVLRNINSN
jgi:aspartate carbamoyltransferase